MITKCAGTPSATSCEAEAGRRGDPRGPALRPAHEAGEADGNPVGREAERLLPRSPVAWSAGRWHHAVVHDRQRQPQREAGGHIAVDSDGSVSPPLHQPQDRAASPVTPLTRQRGA
jgi:hypothetical protein